MNLRIYLFGAMGVAASGIHPAPAALVVQPRQENEDTMDLYLCSNPAFNHDCVGCACERLTNITTAMAYGGPPCCMLLFFLVFSLHAPTFQILVLFPKGRMNCSSANHVFSHLFMVVDPLPDDLRVGNPQGVSSARSYSKWNCTLFE